MRHKILLPTDFSKNSIRAINYARELYKNDHCDFFILNVFSATGNILESLLNLEPGSELYETAKLHSENGLAKVFDMITMSDSYNPKHHFEVFSEFNNVVESIKQFVDKKDIEMIVMGTKGQTHSRATAFGSTAINTMEKVRNCPVLVVPHNAKIELPKEIVFPSNFRTHFKRRELIYLSEIAKKSDANIAILYINKEEKLDEDQRENKELLKEILEGVNYTFHTLSHHSIQSAVNIFVESRSSDMVAFINKKHAFFGSILSNPMVKEISFHLNVPILAMHDFKN
ncbi:nucleotide-binding universal stress UspA family protein [Winogradskyella eximia]|uniref:Nucleotide-binding universal stress UspA family protein n=1 Tax=Winogradskyella eximia TaxID=262006 RepID=A0A3D9H2U7_9FLAO|nr:universal stress protein [Winogradskyella eximia]RED43838.1 nucleotide-binding universal stress UspA family protein [Winogradskyella eximia]